MYHNSIMVLNLYISVKCRLDEIAISMACIFEVGIVIIAIKNVKNIA